MHKKTNHKENSKSLEIESADALQVKPGHFETCWQIPSDLGMGTIKRFCFKSGIQLYIHDYKTLDIFNTQNNDNNPVFGFRFCISGNTKLGLRCFKKNLRVKSNENGFFYFPSTKGFYEDQSGTHIYKVLILINPSSFLSLMEDELHASMQSMIPQHDKENGKAPFNVTGMITPAMHMALQQIIHCPYEDVVRRIFIEAKESVLNWLL